MDISPLHVQTGGNAPLDVDVKLPLTLATDRITVSNGQLNTAQSHIVLSGDMDHLLAPRTSVQANLRVALDELRRAAGLNIPLDLAHGPRLLQGDLSASMDTHGIGIQSAHLTLGKSTVEASGNLGSGSQANFSAALDLGELGRLLRVTAQPEGVVRLAGSARLDERNRYSVDGNIDARQVAFHQGTAHIAGVTLVSRITADTDRIALSNLRLGALGGSFSGSASLVNLTLFQLEGRLQGLEVGQIARALMGKPLGYEGSISGPLQANGNLQRIGELAGRVNLAIAPQASRRAGTVPVSGRINAEYIGRADTVTLAPSYIALPHTRADFSGQLGRQVQVKVVSRSTADLQPLANIPVAFGQTGAATVDATVSGSLSAPKITGTIAANDFSVQARPFTRFSADFGASPSGVTLTNALLARGPLAAQLSASLGLRNWDAPPTAPIRVDATIRNADIKDVLALAEEASLPVSGALTADAHINGTLGSPTGTVDASAVNGLIEGEKFDTLTLQGRMAPDAITVPSLSLVAGASRLDASAVFQHPPNDLQNGSITGKVTANQVQLAQFQSLVKDRPGLSGLISLNADASANLHAGEPAIAALNGNIAVHGLAMEGRALGDLTATANTAGNAVHYNVASDFAGSTIRVTGQSDLHGDHQTSANATISNLPLDRALAIAGRRDLPFAGTLGATAQISGTLADPKASGDLTVANGSAYQEQFTSLQAEVNYSNNSLDVPRFHLADGSSFLDASLSLVHSELRFRLNSNQVHLASVRAVKQYQPSLDGVVQLTADGAAELRPNAAPLFSSLNANIRATGVSVNQQNLGDFTAIADTHGKTVDFNLTSNLAHSDVKGSGSLQLTGDYPVNAHLTFANVTYRGLSPLLTTEAPLPLDAAIEGQVSVSGPAIDTSRLQGSLQITKLDAHSAAVSGVGAKPRVNLDLKNAGDITATLDHGVVTLGNFRLTGSDVNLTAGGTISLNAPGAVRLHASGNVNLAILEAFGSDIYSSGAITLNTTVGGTTANPDINGTLQLQKASFNMLDVPNGLSNATGVVAFNGSEATLRNITGETGGGKVTLSGTVLYGGPQMRFQVQATASHVRVLYPPTITTELSANLSLNGTSARSLVTGTVRIQGVSLHEGADVGNVLTAAAAPPTTPASNPGPLSNMHLDVHIVTSPGVQFRTTLAENLQASANLTLLGTAETPGMLGRVTVTGGTVVFFGNQYTIDQGSMNFYSVNKIDPSLNVELKTTVQGVDVSLSVSGPADKMKLSYSSDPPLPFQQMVSLLASGKMPTTDPVLAAHEPAQPQQNLQQTGASAVLGQAVASPISGRLQRLFGVSKLSIDPQIIGTTNTAQATLTLQQQITPDITFTYIQDVTNSNPEIVRVEWDINPRYSAVAQKDVNGEVTVVLFYKRRFH